MEAAMKIKDVMTTSPACCLPFDTATRPARIMKDRNIGVVPVIETEENRKVVGVVTDRDLCLGVVAEGLDPSSVQVKQCMTPNVIACRPDDDVQKAIESMRDNQVRRIPVVDQEGVIQGMVSTADILQRSDVSSSETHVTLKKVTEPTDEASKPRGEMYRQTA
jgi:CBS domain-containing protein